MNNNSNDNSTSSRSNSDILHNDFHHRRHDHNIGVDVMNNHQSASTSTSYYYEEPQTLKIALQQQLFTSTYSTNIQIENYGDCFLESTIDYQRIPVISAILAARSPYFATLFYGRFGFCGKNNGEQQESSSSEMHQNDTKRRIIKLPYKSILLRAIVEYCYTDTVMVTLLVHQREEKMKKKNVMELQQQREQEQAKALPSSSYENVVNNTTSSIDTTDIANTTTTIQKDQEENDNDDDRYFGWGFIPSTMMELIVVADYFGLRQMCIWIMNKYPPCIWVCLSLFYHQDTTTIYPVVVHPLFKHAYELLETHFDNSILVDEMNELVIPLINQQLLEKIVSDKLLNGISEFQLFRLIQLWVNYHTTHNNHNKPNENQDIDKDENDEDITIKEDMDKVETEGSHSEKNNDDDDDKEEEQDQYSTSSSNNKSVRNKRKERTPKSIAKWLIHDHIRLEYIDTKKFQDMVVPSGLISQKGIAKIYQKRLQMLLSKTNTNDTIPTSPNNNNNNSIYYTANNNDRVLEIIRGSYWNTSPGFDEMKSTIGVNQSRVNANKSPPQPPQQQLQSHQHNEFLEFRPMKLRTIHEWSIKIIKSSPRMSFGVILSKESSLHQKYKQKHIQNENITTGWLIYEMKQQQQQQNCANNISRSEDRTTISNGTARKATDDLSNNRNAEVGGDGSSNSINDDVDGIVQDETEFDSSTSNNDDGSDDTEIVEEANDDSEEPHTTTWSRVSNSVTSPKTTTTSSSEALPPFIKKYHRGNHFSIVQLQNNTDSINDDDDNVDKNNDDNINVLRDGTLIKFKLDLTNQGQLYAKIIQKNEKRKKKGQKKKKKKKGDKGNFTQKNKKKQRNGFVLLFDNLLVMEQDDEDNRRSVRIDGQRSFLPAGAIQGPGKVKFLGIHDRAYL